MDLTSLPPEMLLHVFSYMDQIDLCQLTGQVCKRWCRLSYEPCIRRTVNLDQQIQSPIEIARIVHSSTLTRNLILSRISDWSFTLSLSKNHNLRTIEFNECNLTEYRSSQLVNAFPSVECVRVNFMQFDLRFIREIAQWQFLKEIAVSNKGEYFNVVDWLNLLADKCPYLETLSLPLRLSSIEARPMLDFMKFHGPNLKKISAGFGYMSLHGYEFLAQCPNLKHLHLRTPRALNGAGLCHIRELKFLEKLRIVMATSLIAQDFINLFENHIFLSLLDVRITSCKGVNDLVIEYITKCCPNLKKLELYCCKNVSDSGIKHVVTDCKNIESLMLSLLPINGSCFSDISNEMMVNLKYLLVSNRWEFTEIFHDLKLKRPNLYIEGLLK